MAAVNSLSQNITKRPVKHSWQFKDSSHGNRKTSSRICYPQNLISIQSDFSADKLVIQFELNQLREKMLKPNVYILRSTSKLSSHSEIAESSSLRRIGNVFNKTIERWGLNNVQQNRLLGISELESSDEIANSILSGVPSYWYRETKERIGHVIKIGLGLQVLFSSNKSAEIRWLNAKRHSLNRLTPIEYMLSGALPEFVDVSNLVDHERGL